MVKSERKPRRNIAYKDIGKSANTENGRISDILAATAISRIDNLEFLSDTVPKTKTYRQFREEKAQEAAAKAASSGGVTTNGINGDSGAVSIETMMKNQQQNGVNGVNGSSNGGHGSPIAHRSAHQRTGSHPDPIRDIEMTD